MGHGTQPEWSGVELNSYKAATNFIKLKYCPECSLEPKIEVLFCVYLMGEDSRKKVTCFYLKKNNYKNSFDTLSFAVFAIWQMPITGLPVILMEILI